MQMLTDAQWAKFETAIVAIKLRGARPRKDDRRTIEAILWRLDNGAKWRSIPAELAEGEPKLAFACIDGTVARAHQKAAGARPSKPTR